MEGRLRVELPQFSVLELSPLLFSNVNVSDSSNAPESNPNRYTGSCNPNRYTGSPSWTWIGTFLWFLWAMVSRFFLVRER